MTRHINQLSWSMFRFSGFVQQVILVLLAVLCALLSVVTGTELRTEDSTLIPWVTVILVLLVVGLLAVLIIEIVIIYKIVSLGGVPCRSIWLGQLLLVAIVLSYLTLVIFIFQPDNITCTLLRFFIGFCYILIQSILIVKILLVVSPKSQVGFLKLGHQLFILLLIWAVQIIINVQWIILAPSSTEARHNDVVVCQPTHTSSLFNDFLYSFVYIFIMGLILTALTASTYFRNRKWNGKPNSEAKWILITSCVTTATWLAWIIVGALLPETAIAALAVGLWVTATATLLIMFVPKLHKLATLKDGDPECHSIEEFYIEDDIPGMLPYDQNGEAIEMNGNVTLPRSYRTDSVILSETDGRHLSGGTLERSPSVILEERSDISGSSVGPSPSVVYNPNNPYALELRHPTTHSIKRANSSAISHEGGSYSDYEHPQRYYTIGGHGRHSGSNSVIGAPRYERRYVQAPSAHYHSHEPHYVREVITSPHHHIDTDSSTSTHSHPYSRYTGSLHRQHTGKSASVIGVPRYEGPAARRYMNGYTNPAFTLKPHKGTIRSEPVKYVEVIPRKASSVVDAPSYGPKILRQVDVDQNGLKHSRRSLSQHDLRMGPAPNHPHQPIVVTGTLPRNTKLVYKPVSNGHVLPVEQRQRAFRDDLLERSSVY